MLYQPSGRWAREESLWDGDAIDGRSKNESSRIGREGKDCEGVVHRNRLGMRHHLRLVERGVKGVSGGGGERGNRLLGLDRERLDLYSSGSRGNKRMRRR